jgi:hypothetical protein
MSRERGFFHPPARVLELWWPLRSGPSTVLTLTPVISGFRVAVAERLDPEVAPLALARPHQRSPGRSRADSDRGSVLRKRHPLLGEIPVHRRASSASKLLCGDDDRGRRISARGA